METKTFQFDDDNIELKFATAVNMSLSYSNSQKCYLELSCDNSKSLAIKNEKNSLSVTDLNNPSLTEIFDALNSFKTNGIDFIKNLSQFSHQIINIDVKLYILNTTKIDMKINKGVITNNVLVDSLLLKLNKGDFTSWKSLKKADIKLNQGNLNIFLDNNTEDINLKINNGNLNLSINNYLGSINGKTKLGNNIDISGETSQSVNFIINNGNFIMTPGV